MKYNRKKANKSGYILKKLDSLEAQAKQIKSEIETIEFEANDLSNKIISADIIQDNLKVFRNVYDHLTSDEKYDFLHLLIKKVTYYESSADEERRKIGKIKMDLWELPPINPSKLDSAIGFAESLSWLPSADSNHGHAG